LLTSPRIVHSLSPSLTPSPPPPTLSPYTTLFRSSRGGPTSTSPTAPTRTPSPPRSPTAPPSPKRSPRCTQTPCPTWRTRVSPSLRETHHPRGVSVMSPARAPSGRLAARLVPYGFLAPAIVLSGLLILLPIAYTLYLSVRRIEVFGLG